jgi:hypothetical protein
MLARKRVGAVFVIGIQPGTRIERDTIRIDILGNPSGVAVDLAKMTTDSGEEVQIKGNTWGRFLRIIDVAAIPTNAQTVDITLAVQKTRSVEFFVKPPIQ